MRFASVSVNTQVKFRRCLMSFILGKFIVNALFGVCKIFKADYFRMITRKRQREKYKDKHIDFLDREENNQTRRKKLFFFQYKILFFLIQRLSRFIENFEWEKKSNSMNWYVSMWDRKLREETFSPFKEANIWGIQYFWEVKKCLKVLNHLHCVEREREKNVWRSRRIRSICLVTKSKKSILLKFIFSWWEFYLHILSSFVVSILNLIS